MNLLRKLLRRIFSTPVHKTTDESKNVVYSMVKAKKLYKELILKAHPDKNINNRELAEEYTRMINLNRYNYSYLLELNNRINNDLNK